MEMGWWCGHGHASTDMKIVLSSGFFRSLYHAMKTKHLVVTYQYAILLAHIKRFWLVRMSTSSKKIYFISNIVWKTLNVSATNSLGTKVYHDSMWEKAKMLVTMMDSVDNDGSFTLVESMPKGKIIAYPSRNPQVLIISTKPWCTFHFTQVQILAPKSP